MVTILLVKSYEYGFTSTRPHRLVFTEYIRLENEDFLLKYEIFR